MIHQLKCQLEGLCISTFQDKTVGGIYDKAGSIQNLQTFGPLFLLLNPKSQL